MFDAGYPIIILKFEQTCFLFSLLFDFSFLISMMKNRQQRKQGI